MNFIRTLNLNSGNKKAIILIFLTISWMCAIFLFSALPAYQSAGLSGKIAQWMLQTLGHIFNGRVPEFISAGILFGDHYVRKFGHFFEYLVLGILWSCTLREMGIKKAPLCSIIICAVYAASDEFHQIFVPGRGPLITDILLDSASAVIGSLLICFYRFSRLVDKISTK